MKTSAFSHHEILKFYITHAIEKVSLNEAKNGISFSFFSRSFVMEGEQ